jgi:hypothetical protein
MISSRTLSLGVVRHRLTNHSATETTRLFSCSKTTKPRTGAGGRMIVRAERPSSIVRPDPESAKKKSATAVDVGQQSQRGPGGWGGSVWRRSAARAGSVSLR